MSLVVLLELQMRFIKRKRRTTDVEFMHVPNWCVVSAAYG
jgi:hypothetical protein